MVKHRFYNCFGGSVPVPGFKPALIQPFYRNTVFKKHMLAFAISTFFVFLAFGAVGQAAENEILMTISTPANGTHFVAGESPVITVSLPEQYVREDYSQLRFHIAGPIETTQTKTAVKLLNASADRSARPHHYIDLIADTNVTVAGNVLTYNLQPVSDEAPGTYAAGLWAVMKDSTIQSFPLVDFQIGTSAVETQIVEREKCASCHQGADSGQYYFHHVDPGSVGSYGNPSLDSWAVRTCKSCHNNDGYAAYRDPADSNVRIADPIVHRVHGVHMGKNLENPRNIDPDTGIFKDYINVEFPADVRNCTKCHVDNRWKTAPSRLACGACHDNIWFGSPATMPPTAEAHPGGSQTTDAGCSFCHPPDTGGAKPIAEAHRIEPPAFKQIVELGMTLPANGTYYVAGETPQVTITVKDAATGAVIDPAAIVEPADAKNVAANEWRRANLYVSGPRDHTVPVLSDAAAHVASDHYYANNDFRVRIDPNNEDPRIVRSAAGITYQLDDVAGLEPGTYTAFVEIMPAVPLGAWAMVNFQVGTQTEEPKICTNCTDCHDDTRMHASYFAVQFNPDICKSCHDYQHQSSGKTGWNDANWGFGAAPLSRRVHGVHRGHYLDKPEEIHGVADVEHFGEIIFPQDIRNCTKCHADNPMWKEEPSRIACLSCHDKDESIYHGMLMTFDFTDNDPYSGDEIETCIVCHGSHSDFSPDKMHNISNPYKPPYPRERQED